jgi:hypothetical protein
MKVNHLHVEGIHGMLMHQMFETQEAQPEPILAIEPERLFSLPADVIRSPFSEDPDERLWCGTCDQFANGWCKEFKPGSLYNVEFVETCPLDKEKRQ